MQASRMYSGRQVYETALAIVMAKGEHMPSTSLDPFTSAGLCFRDGIIEIVALKTLGCTVHNQLIDMQRVIVYNDHRPWASPGGWAGDQAFEVVYDDTLVFDATCSANEVDIYHYASSERWCDHLMNVRRLLPTKQRSL
jgi:hypothetical protein